jgi:VanZ family protein
MNKIYLQNIIYNSGDVFLPEKIKNILGTDLIGTSKKTFYVSGWSIVHFINGIIFGYLYLYFNYDVRLYTYKMFIIHTIWEFWQMLIGMSKPYELVGRSNLVDTIMDTIFFMLGTYIVRNFYNK